MSDKKPIIILHDKLEALNTLDQQETVQQAQMIQQALTDLGYHSTLVPFSKDLRQLRKYKGSLLFNLVETYEGSDVLHTIPLYARHYGCVVTGGNAHSLYTTGDKLLAKTVMKQHHIPTPKWIESSNHTHLQEFLHTPFIIKPRSEEGSVGIDDHCVQQCSTIDELEKIYHTSQEQNLLIEQFIDGREFNVSIINKEDTAYILPIAEMEYFHYPKDKPKILGYEAKWEVNSFAYEHTQRRFLDYDKEASLMTKIKEITTQCWNLFSSPSYARVDLRGDEKENLYVLEVNVNPSLHYDSGFIAACKEGGYSYNDVIQYLIKEAYHEHTHF
ncbi:MAG: ATP-grasp domain-containing protein [Sphaerochaetaceae bacterium]